MTNNPKTRAEVPVEFTWDLSGLYASQEEWERDFNRIPEKLEAIIELKGQLSASPGNLLSCLKNDDALNRLLEKLYTYAHRRSDEDLTNTENRALLDRITSIYHDCAGRLAWMRPEIMAIDDELMESFLAAGELAFYRFALQQTLRYKPHTLSNKEERILAMAGEVFSLPHKAFSMLNDADIRFPLVTDEQGSQLEMTHGLYGKFLQSYDRRLRRDAFTAMYTTFQGFINTAATLLDGAVKANVFNARVRNYPSALAASLFRDNVNPDVYKNLISVINDKLPVFHQYVDLRKRVLKVSDLDMYDMYTPLVEDFNLEISWDQAVEWVIESLKPLGNDYQTMARQAFTERWVDVPENRGKRSGAYSGGCYDSLPFILMNYNRTLNSVFTLAHELGHSMHSYLANHSQQYRYAEYPILLAEIASTTNELLLLDYLLKQTSDTKMKKYLLNYYCDGVKGTVYRQTQFAEYELELYTRVEKGTPLTVEELSSSYYNLNARYYGPQVKADDAIKLEWARIPHFYYNFYVYKYATGYSAATCFAEGILSGDKQKTAGYLEVLKAGCSEEPLVILKKAGLDLSRPDPILAGLVKFKRTVGELGELL